MPNFNRVVIKNNTEQAQNIHISVHPFKCEYWIRSSHGPGDYGFSWDIPDMPIWQKKLMDNLWEELPGVETIFFMNGKITIQHCGVFEDEEIFEAAVAVIEPVLAQNLALKNINTD